MGVLPDDERVRDRHDPSLVQRRASAVLFGKGLGSIARFSTGAVASLLSPLAIPPPLHELVPHSRKTTLGAYVPIQAGSQIYSRIVRRARAWTGLGAFALYVATAFTLRSALINSRDA